MIFLDNASTTPCNKQSAEIMVKSMVENYFNPSAKYNNAFLNSKELDNCRREILNLINAKETDFSVVFTGSATEANNLILNSSANKHRENIISIGEHSSIYETAKMLRGQGYNFLECPLNKDGELNIDAFKNMMTPETSFVSVMLVSNETGAITNLKEVVSIAKKVNPKVLVHADAVQGFCKIKINMQEWGLDYLTLSSHKVEGPKGVGALVYRKKSKLEPQIHGGGQEMGKRSGTENLPAILGFVNSAKELVKNLNENFNRVKTFKQNLINEIIVLSKKEGLEFIINGNEEKVSPYILSCGFVGTKGEVLLHALEAEGVLVGTGSACNSKHSGNRVLSAMAKTKEEVECNIRISFSKNSVIEDYKQIAEKIVRLAKKHNNTAKKQGRNYESK